MKRTLVLTLLLFVPWTADVAAERQLQEISWIALRDQGALPAGLRVQPDGSLLVRSEAGKGLGVTLVEIASPGITADRYVVRGRVRYRGVVGDGYLEMWNLFGDGGRYFTRTLADIGPLQKITESSDWRDFGLYFDATGAKAPPEKLTIGLVLPGAGEVSISSLTLSELDAGEALENPGRFWGIAGAFLGTVGAILGSLAGAGRARTLVLTGLNIMMATGAVGLVLSILFLVRSDPYHASYPLLVLSTIALAVPAFSLRGIRRRYEELELRRMSALDA